MKIRQNELYNAHMTMTALGVTNDDLLIAVLRHSPDGNWRALDLDMIVEIVASVLRGTYDLDEDDVC